MAWYDNEWGFCNRMLDNTMALLGADQTETTVLLTENSAESSRTQQIF
jgi:hypothetical protein